jgi:hypothetical protein
VAQAREDKSRGLRSRRRQGRHPTAPERVLPVCHRQPAGLDGRWWQLWYEREIDITLTLDIRIHRLSEFHKLLETAPKDASPVSTPVQTIPLPARPVWIR